MLPTHTMLFGFDVRGLRQAVIDYVIDDES
jgi:hypothetical protein